MSPDFHPPHLDKRSIPWSACHVDHLPNTGGIVLKYEGLTTLYMDCGCVGLSTEELNKDPGVAYVRAIPIFKAMIIAHNAALSMGHEQGREEVQRQMREALGVL